MLSRRIRKDLLSSPRAFSRWAKRRLATSSTSMATTSRCIACWRQVACGCFLRSMRLLSHWNLRDQIRADYAEAALKTRARAPTARPGRDGAHRDADHPGARNRWQGFRLEPGRSLPATATRVSPTHAMSRILDVAAAFRAGRSRSHPTAPTFIARVFEEREIPEQRVRHMLTRGARVTAGSPRCGHDPRTPGPRICDPSTSGTADSRRAARTSAAELDAITARRYPDAAAYRAGHPTNLLDEARASRSNAPNFSPGTSPWTRRAAQGHAMGRGHAGRAGAPAYPHRKLAA